MRVGDNICIKTYRMVLSNPSEDGAVLIQGSGNEPDIINADDYHYTGKVSQEVSTWERK